MAERVSRPFFTARGGINDAHPGLVKFYTIQESNLDFPSSASLQTCTKAIRNSL